MKYLLTNQCDGGRKTLGMVLLVEKNDTFYICFFKNTKQKNPDSSDRGVIGQRHQ